jgi:ribosomal protein L11 methyltransferase
MLSLDFRNKKVLDAGCGTGILSILASRMGATHILAIDNHPYAVENTLENGRVNNIPSISVMACEVGTLKETTGFDYILANINLQVILQEMKTFCSLLADQGTLILSGFFVSDIEKVTSLALEQQMKVGHKSVEEEWACLILWKSQRVPKGDCP